jgi:Kef-type K+ transport system membrane component KefB
MNELFIQLSLVLGIALVVSLIMKALRQPLIIGYIITGIIVGPAATGMLDYSGPLEAFSHIGIALLLFIVGLSLKPRVVREVGKVAILTGLAQILFTTIIGYFICQALGFEQIVSFYLALAFSLSSTIIIFRLLYTKEEQDTLYGRITIGFLLVQDLVAILFFIVLSSTAKMGSGDFIPFLVLTVAKVVLVILGLYLLMKYVTPKIDKMFADNSEMLFIFAIGVCFVISTIFYELGFSLELGALIAGFMLSMSPYQREIASKIQTLRDFFLIIFFISMGSHIVVNDIASYLPLIIIFSLFISIGNPIILMLVMRAMRYTMKTSFLAGVTVSQISEFSLIILAMGVTMGHLPESILAPATLIGLITIGMSTYFISYNNQMYDNFFGKYLERYFTEKRSRKEKSLLKKHYSVILFGCHIMGTGLIKQLAKAKTKFLAVDHDPTLIDSLTEKNIECLFGSAEDINFLDSIPMAKAKMVMSTIPSVDVNLSLLSYLKKKKKNFNFIAVANHFHDADRLYKKGATYVIMPPYLGRRFMVDLYNRNKLLVSKYKQERKKHLEDLKYVDELEQFF